MTIKEKVFHIDGVFTKELPSADEQIDSIYISGYASVNVPDRAGDVVPSSVWEDGIKNYLKNPIVLAYHDHDDPVGRVVEHKIDDKGLWVKARISAAAEVFNLIKDNVLTAFSVGFRIHDAEYKPDAELFIIKKLELLEISVVSVPCNQDTLFSLSKSFNNDEEYKLFKSQFTAKSESAKGLESSNGSNGKTSKEIGMDPKELQKMLDDAATSAAEKAAAKLLEVQKAEKEAAEKAAREEAELQKRIAEAVAKVTPSTTGAEKLLEEVTKRLEDETASTKKALEGLEATIKEKSAELEAIQKSKMKFSNSNPDEISYAEKEKAVLLAKVANKGIVDTKFGRQLAEKALGAPTTGIGAHQASQTWEHEVSLNMEEEVRRKLVVAPIFRTIQMNTNVMSFPLNPEAGDAQWMANAAFGTTTSAGNTVVHQLKEITLNAYKVATNEYVAYEEEEDSLIVLLPIIRDAMIRRVARSVDKAFLLGAGAGSDPVKGILTYDATSAVTIGTASPTATVSHLRQLRRDLGAWGLDTNDVTYIVSTDVYYDLLEDTNFQTMDKVGPNATLLTGQIGVVGNSPVLVSSMFPTKATGANTATTNYCALAVATANFLVGNQRGLRIDTQDLVETQRRVLVASLRTGMTQLTTNLGQGVSALRWLNA